MYGFLHHFFFLFSNKYYCSQNHERQAGRGQGLRQPGQHPEGVVINNNIVITLITTLLLFPEQWMTSWALPSFHIVRFGWYLLHRFILWWHLWRSQNSRLYRTMNDKLGVAKASGNLGNTLKVMGKFKEAILCCERHLLISQELDDKVGWLFFYLCWLLNNYVCTSRPLKYMFIYIDVYSCKKDWGHPVLPEAPAYIPGTRWQGSLMGHLLHLLLLF